MTLAVLPKFNNIQDGIDFMSNFSRPCAFQVGNDNYDYNGNVLDIPYSIIEIQLDKMYMIQMYGDSDTSEGVLYVESGICKCNKIDE
jgi:hypothetical protein